MSNIDKQGRQVQRYANFGVDMMEWADGGYVRLSDYLALLDELEAKDRVWAAQDNHINQQADRIESLEKKNGDLGRALCAAEKRIADYQELISGLVGVSSSILREVERINKAAGTAKGE